MDFEIWKQRREEMMREAQQEHLAKALRASRKRRGSGGASSGSRGIKRIAGRLRKRLGLKRSVRHGGGRHPEEPDYRPTARERPRTKPAAGVFGTIGNPRRAPSERKKGER